ncbi:hypothetical protein OGATHE_001725 [Ogataea polymorpha]|uniref:Secreted protein n=1 Tax=Ogataea polymorpha TaxID=460523 RepID=A0A9P8PPM7_9ASCO|nr:hypothetical protein OGATHE_001725 [Ogataea polymorpha]
MVTVAMFTLCLFASSSTLESSNLSWSVIWVNPKKPAEKGVLERGVVLNILSNGLANTPPASGENGISPTPVFLQYAISSSSSSL